MLKHLFLLLCGIISVFAVRAVEEPAKVAPLEGRLGQLVSGVVAEVTDTDFFDDLSRSPKKYRSTAVRNILTFSIDEGSPVYLKTPFTATLTYRLYYNLNASPGQEVSLGEDQVLEIQYDTAKSKSYRVSSSFVFEDAVKVKVEIVSVTTTASGWDPVQALKFTNEMRISRIYTFDCEINKVAVIQYTPPQPEADELEVSWIASEGADEYDLEWAYIDNAAYHSNRYGVPGSVAFGKNIFKHNASRATLSSKMTGYKIPLLYENDGRLFFRVRAVQTGAFEKRTETHWSEYHSFEYVAGHQAHLNWQSSTVFAEEGKRKSVLQYFDGSLRNRQTITKDNASNTTVVAESMYDYQGRPVIQVLPTPTISSVIKHTPQFNHFLNSNVYYKDNYDKIFPGNDECDGAAPALDPARGGAAQYYSPLNPEKDQGNNKLIPDANGFPFTETKFLRDNTGRISAQSGVGADHRLGSGHETRYYYGNPDQSELDALFGTEAGDASHYLKNMARDANGQYSVSYLDMYGRTIATALAGDLPPTTQLDYLPSKQNDYLVKTLTSPSNNRVKGFIIESTKGLLVTQKGAHQFSYSLLPENVNIQNCTKEEVCYSCSYDLEITISDDCGNKQFGGTPYMYKDVIGNISVNCTNLPALFTRNFSKVLEEGSYTITKRLTIRDEAITRHQQTFAGENLCQTVQDFVQEQKNIFLEMTNNCATPCITCKAQLGNSEQEFITEFITVNGLNSQIATDRQLALEAYQKLSAQCYELCGISQPLNYLDQLRMLMLHDMTPPYGQYADLSDFEITGGQKIYYKNGIFGRVSEGSSQLRYTIASIAYKDANDTPAITTVMRNGQLVALRPQQLTIEEFAANFQPSWAEALADNLHPEIMHYRLLALTPNAINQPAVGRGNYDWDRDFITTETFSEAMQKGYLNPTGYPSFTAKYPRHFVSVPAHTDPFFSMHNGQRNQMHDYMSRVASDGSAVLDIWNAASVSALCNDQHHPDCLYAQVTDPFSTAACDADLDMAWRAFRAMYKAKKDSLIRVMVNSYVYGAPYLDPAKYHSYFSDPRSTITANTGIHNPESKAEVDAALENFYRDGNTCEGYSDLWWNSLTPCDTLKLQMYKTQLLTDLVTVCRKGTDKDHIMGASSIAPGADNAFNDFGEVLAHYRQLYNQSHPDDPISIADCNGSLLNFPASYNTPQVVANKSVITRPEPCECERITILHTAFEQDGRDADFAAYILRTLQTRISNGALDTLMGLCAGNSDCRNLSQLLFIPPALQCGMDAVCMPCNAVAAAHNEFKAQYPGYLPMADESASEQQGRINELFRHFMNRRFGFNKFAQEYLAFIDSCAFRDQNMERDSLQALKDRYNRNTNPLRVRVILQSNSLNPKVYDDDISKSIADGVLRWPQEVRDTALGYFEYFQHVVSGSRYCFENGYAVEFRFKFLKNDIRDSEEFFYYTDANGEFVLYRRASGPEEKRGIFLLRIKGVDPATGSKININNDITLISRDPDLIFKEWTTMKFDISATHFKVYANNVLLREVSAVTAPLKNIGGFTLCFMHFQAALDWTRIYDHTGKQMFFDDYLSNHTRQIINSSFLCPQPAATCEQSFTHYFNQQKGTGYSFMQLDSLYTAAGLVLDVCGLDKTTLRCDQLEGYAVEYKQTFVQPAAGYTDLDMRTFAGNKTPDEGPKGVFDVKGKLLGNTIDSSPVSIKESFVQIWNSSADNREVGTLSLLESGRFRLTLKPGKQVPAEGIIGQRYYQVDAVTDVLNGLITGSGTYIDFGDSTGTKVNDLDSTSVTITESRSPDLLTTVYPNPKIAHSYYTRHYYPSTATRTVTIYHSDYNARIGFDCFEPSDCGIYATIANLRGYFPQDLNEIYFHTTHDSTLNNFSQIKNFDQINSITDFSFSRHNSTGFRNNRLPDFSLNHGLRVIALENDPGVPASQTKKIDDYLPDLPGKFPYLNSIVIRPYDTVFAGSVNFRLPELRFLWIQNAWISSSYVLTPQKIDEIINQVAEGTRYNNGALTILPHGATTRTAASDSAVARLTAKGWRLMGAGMNEDVPNTIYTTLVEKDTLPQFTAFSDFLNSKLNTNFTAVQIDSLYIAVCGYKPDLTTISETRYADRFLCDNTIPHTIPVEARNQNTCVDSLDFAISRGYDRYAAYRDSLIGEFNQTFINKCLEAVIHENFTVRQPVSEYHYTLYYYDQAGNLVKTVPPKGVKPNFDSAWLQQVRDARWNKMTVTPAHEMTTQYRYNTLNQMVQQLSPDAGKSKFWHDRLGRLAVSQNAQQAKSDADGAGTRYSYTRYDYLGRITEVGQVSNGSPDMSFAISRNPQELQNWMNSNLLRRQQVVLTVYDQPAKESYMHKDLSPYILRERDNLRNRVSFTVFSRSGDLSLYDHATFYHYDIHGNVDTLLQDYSATGIMAQNGSRYKRLAYSYDLISGKINTVSYQPRLYDPVTKQYITQPDAFYHKYVYDAENRLTDVFTSTDQVYWEHEAYYRYYKHGPLSRMVLGHQQVQAVDYAYTLQGWLKGINGTAVGNGVFDAGQDGIGSNLNRWVARDAFGLSLQYYENDYVSIQSTSHFANITAALGTVAKPLYNGNISSMAVNIPMLGDARIYAYSYDQLNRITGMDAYRGFNNSNNVFTPVALDDYGERISYDANGNILTYKRNGDKSGVRKTMDNLTYNYKAKNNQIKRVRDAVPAGYYMEDIDDQPANNYDYDAVGNLISDASEGISNISWTVHGKIERITKTDGTTIVYNYDAAGNRISKTTTSAGATAITVYVRDAQGNTLSVYEQNSAVNGGHFTQSELHLYGSDRLGIYKVEKDLTAPPAHPVNMGYENSGRLVIFERNKKLFELTNHLGNVLATVSDNKIGISVTGTTVDHYVANVVSAQDYYPFGMQMPGRTFRSGVSGTLSNVEGYRYGFNGKENDNDITSAAQDYGMRIYDGRLGRFLSVDPLVRDYAFYSPYQYAGNKPIRFTDLDGLEENSNSTDVKIPIPILPVINKDRILSAPKGYLFQADTRTQEQRRAAIQRAEHTKSMNRMYNTDEGFSFRIFSGIGTSALSYGEGVVAEYTIGKGLQGIRFLKNVITNAGKIPSAGIRGVNLVSAEVFSDAQKVALGGNQALKAINTPYGIAEQAISREAYTAIDEVNRGATLYRIGTLGKSQAGEAQFWSLENPANFLNNPETFASKFGMPAENLKSGQLFIEAGKLEKGASFVTRPAPGVGANQGGAIEVVTNPGSVKLETFNVIKQ